MLVFFLGFLPPSRGLALLVIFGMGLVLSEGLFVAVGDRGTGAAAPAAVARATGGAGGAAALAPVVAVDLGGSPAQAGADLVGHDLDHAALLAVLGLVGALLQPTGDDGARSLRQGRGGVLAQLAPGRDVEEGRLLLPLAVLLVAAADGDAERGDGLAALGEAQLGIAGQVPDEGDGAVCHGGLPFSWPARPCRGARLRGRAGGGACGGRPRPRGAGGAPARRASPPAPRR